LPVIGANVGGIPDIIEPGVSGLLCEKGNAKDLAEKIVQIYDSEMLRARLRAGAEKKLPTFDIAHTSTQYSQVYSEIGL
jgi:glycosyltransferase involved in cell wall biosynthesis